MAPEGVADAAMLTGYAAWGDSGPVWGFPLWPLLKCRVPPSKHAFMCVVLGCGGSWLDQLHVSQRGTWQVTALCWPNAAGAPTGCRMGSHLALDGLPRLQGKSRTAGGAVSRAIAFESESAPYDCPSITH